MTESPDRVLIVEADHPLNRLAGELEAAGLRMEEFHTPRDSSGFQRMERTFNATFPVTELIMVAGSPAAIHGAAAVIREYLRSRRRNVKICRADGSSIEIEGDIDIQELEEIIDAVTVSSDP